MKKIKISSICPQCGKENILEVYEDDFKQYQKDKNVYKHFPYLTESQQDLLITTVCDECWNKFLN